MTGNGATGTVTFLFTDIEGSTQRWQQDGNAMSEALEAHDAELRSVVERHGGTVFKHTGDGMCAVFTSATAAVQAAVEAQRGLELPVRMGLHSGEAESRYGDFFGPALNLAARVMDAGHGGQVLLSSATAALVRDYELRDLGKHQLKGLDTAEQIFQVGTEDFPALRTLRPTVGNLPAEASTFVGRSHEVTSLVDQLVNHRLVTLIGVGGIGKTRLAIETATTMAPSFPDGCWLVELASLAVEDSVPFAFADGLGMPSPPEGDVIDHLVARLRDKRSLVVVDNCEHVLAAAADAVERIVARCPAITVLATSREPLMVRGERLVPVPSLAPEDAERLFLERARDETPELVMDDDQQRAIVELCHRLDGLPLALELAASRLRAFTPVELVANLDERFRLLTGGRRSRMERHQTMRGTLDWSYDLCRDVERSVFDRLSVFPAGFDLAGARAVAVGDGVSELDVVDAVSHLLDRSLLQRFTAADGTTRFRMLETMRAYGREHLHHLGIAEATREQYARYVARTVGALTLRRFGPDEEWVVRRLNEYLPDALVTLDWSIDHNEWDIGLHVIHAGRPSAEREANEMLARLHHAARAGGAPIEVLDELASWDAESATTLSIDEANDRGWRIIRAKMPIPSNRVVLAPFADVAVTAENVDEFVSSLERWRSAPSASRFWAEYLALRSLACSVALHPELDQYVDPLVEQFAGFVESLASKRGLQRLAEVRGLVARQRRDWSDAVKWYSEIVRSRRGGPQTLFTLADAWNLMTVRSLDAAPFEITGAELRDPWLTYRDLHADSMRWDGATSTALALQRLGHTGLADRFVVWAWTHDTVGIMSRYFEVVLEIAGLPTEHVDSSDDLDTLIQELFVIADRLDVAATQPGGYAAP